jgi:hypothetical protein
VSVRGTRFLPDESLQFVAIDYLCRVCGSGDHAQETRLLRHCVSTTHDRFEDERTWFAGASAADDGFVSEDPDQQFSPLSHLRHKMRCPLCGHTPEYRMERLVAALRAVYEPARRAVIPFKI